MRLRRYWCWVRWAHKPDAVVDVASDQLYIFKCLRCGRTRLEGQR